MVSKSEIAYFAGGCFWCVQPPFNKTKGVTKTYVGYMGGEVSNPTYKQVCTGKTGHTEALKVEFDPSIVSYDDLLKVFWHQIDPTTLNGQFCDMGTQYRTGIYYINEMQKKLALASREKLENSGLFRDKLVTEILPASDFWMGEEEHQDFYLKNPTHYQCYRESSGRDEFIKSVWGS